MLALLRKNLWLWHPKLSANWLVTAFALAFAAADARWEFVGGWIPMIVMIGLLGGAAGSSALDTDFKEHNDRFLEYLPVRWSHVWLAASLNELAACGVVILCLTGYRVLSWAPQQGEDGGVVESLLFASRWDLLLMLGAVIFYSFASSMFWRTFFRGEKSAIVPQLLGQMLFVWVPVAALALTQLLPSSRGLAWVLLQLGAGFLAAAFFAFVLPPRHWGKWRQFLVYGSPLLIALFVYEMSLLYVWSGRWAKLDWSEPRLRHHSARWKEGSADSEAGGAVKILSMRSGDHTYWCDPVSGRTWHLGRRMILASGTATGPKGTLLAAFMKFRPNDLWPTRERLVIFSPDRSVWREVGEMHSLVQEGHKANRMAWAADGKHLLVTTMNHQGLLPSLIVMDQNGQVLKKMFLSSIDSDIVTSHSGRMVTRAASSESPGEGDEEPLRLRVGEIAGTDEREVELPGNVLCFSRDLHMAYCWREQVRDGMREYSLVQVSLDDGAEQVLIADAGSMSASSRPMQTTFGSSFAGERERYEPWRTAPMAWVSADGGQIVWLARRMDQQMRRMSLMHLDVAAGTRRVLVGEQDLPSTSIMEDGSESRKLRVWGFTRDGREFIHQMENTVCYTGVDSGQVRKAEVDELDSIQLSPNGKRILRHSRDGERADSVWQVLDGERALTVQGLDGADSVEWIDDENLLVTRRSSTSIVSLDGGPPRRLLPPADDSGR
jgi:hypothetical protein